MPQISRRSFLQTSAAASLGWGLAGGVVSAQSAPLLRAAIIGHTGRGDYGHDLDLIFKGRDGIELVAVADPDPAGRAKAMGRSGAARSYADWLEMLGREKPQLVSVAMRQAVPHSEIVLACVRAGAHVYCEKPFTTCPAESDVLLAEAGQRRSRIAVAHNMRMMPAVSAVKRMIENGGLGDVVEMRAFGKQDARSGGEDLMVLGTHLFDLMRLIAGDPVSCAAQVLQEGKPVNRDQARRVKDDVGWVAGDQVFATFGFAHGVVGTFTSAAKLKETTGRWGLEIHGSRGVARINCDLIPAAFQLQTSGWGNAGRQDNWKAVDTAGFPVPPAPQFNAVSDWLQSVAQDREPFCSARNGAWAVEMVMGVYEAALTGRRVEFPLKRRKHPLEA